MERRGSQHFSEACQIIDQLIEDKERKTYAKNFRFSLSRKSYDSKKRKQVITEDIIIMNRVQMIERLEWISSLDFGDDISAWEEWMKLRKEEGFAVGRG